MIKAFLCIYYETMAHLSTRIVCAFLIFVFVFMNKLERAVDVYLLQLNIIYQKFCNIYNVLLLHFAFIVFSEYLFKN